MKFYEIKNTFKVGSIDSSDLVKLGYELRGDTANECAIYAGEFLDDMRAGGLIVQTLVTDDIRHRDAGWGLRSILQEYTHEYEVYLKGKLACTERTKDVLELLYNLHKSPYRGICGTLDTNNTTCASGRGIVMFLSEGWGKHTGNVDFPVPCKDMEPAEAYMHYTDNDSMWLGEYGKNRQELLNYMINKLEGMLK